MDENKPRGKNNRFKLEAKIRSSKTNKIQSKDNWEEDDLKYFDIEKSLRKNLIRLALSIGIFVFVFGINALPFSITKQISNGIKLAISYETNLKEDVLGKKDFVPAMGNAIKKFVNPEELDNENVQKKDFKTPVEGKITSSFGEVIINPVFNTKIETKGVEISGKSNRDIYAIGKGKVIRIQDSVYGGKRIVIEHSSSFKSVYEGCYDSELEENQELEQGDIIGKTKDIQPEIEASIFYFELWKGDHPVNPTEYMELTLEATS